MSIFTVCFTGMRVWVGIPGGPAAAATLALEEKEDVSKKRDRGIGSGGYKPGQHQAPWRS